MAVSPTGYLSNTCAVLEATLALCPTFLKLMTPPDEPATLTAAAVFQRGVWQQQYWKGPVPRYLIVIDNGTDDEQAIRSVHHVLHVALALTWPIDRRGCDTDRDFGVLASNDFGALLAELAQQQGQPGCLTKSSRDFEPPALTGDNAGADANCWDATILFRLDI